MELFYIKIGFAPSNTKQRKKVVKVLENDVLVHYCDVIVKVLGGVPGGGVRDEERLDCATGNRSRSIKPCCWFNSRRRQYIMTSYLIGVVSVGHLFSMQEYRWGWEGGNGTRDFRVHFCAGLCFSSFFPSVKIIKEGDSLQLNTIGYNVMGTDICSCDLQTKSVCKSILWYIRHLSGFDLTIRHKNKPLLRVDGTLFCEHVHSLI